jgi:hypothetical protein
MQRSPKNPRRSSRSPSGFASSQRQAMNRSHAQELRRAGSEPSFQTKVKRQQYWTQRLSEQAQQANEYLQDNEAQLGFVAPGSDTPFAAATLKTETLQEVDPNQGELEAGNLQSESGYGAASDAPASNTDAPAPS